MHSFGSLIYKTNKIFAKQISQTFNPQKLLLLPSARIFSFSYAFGIPSVRFLVAASGSTSNWGN
jgi:hypothetical protein